MRRIEVHVGTSPIVQVRRAVALIAVAGLLAAAATVAPSLTRPAAAVNQCLIQTCWYLTFEPGGNGTGDIAVNSFQYSNGSLTTATVIQCHREGGLTTGTCSKGFVIDLLHVPSYITINATFSVSSGSRFCYQGVCGSAAGTYSFPITGNATLGATYASFELTGTVATANVTLAGTGTGTVTSTPQGIDCPGKCSADFTSGTSVKFTETPGGTSVWGGWSPTSCFGTLGSTSCSWSITGTFNITATFNLPATPKPTVAPTATPKATSRPTATPTAAPHPTPTLAPGATPRPTTAGGGGTTSTPPPGGGTILTPPPNDQGSPGTSEGANPTDQAPSDTGLPGDSLAPIATPPASPVSSSGGDGTLIVIPIVVALLAVGGYLFLGRLRRT